MSVSVSIAPLIDFGFGPVRELNVLTAASLSQCMSPVRAGRFPMVRTLDVMTNTASNAVSSVLYEVICISSPSTWRIDWSVPGVRLECIVTAPPPFPSFTVPSDAAAKSPGVFWKLGGVSVGLIFPIILMYFEETLVVVAVLVPSSMCTGIRTLWYRRLNRVTWIESSTVGIKESSSICVRVWPLIL